jgi:hypothetical protein
MLLVFLLPYIKPCAMTSSMNPSTLYRRLQLPSLHEVDGGYYIPTWNYAQGAMARRLLIYNFTHAIKVDTYLATMSKRRWGA